MRYHIITQNKQKNWTWVTTVETKYTVLMFNKSTV